MAKIKQEGYAYGSVLEALSKGLYPDKMFVLREFVQNAFDALRELRAADGERADRAIEITIDEPSITIYDEGVGMDEQQMQQYRYLGHSQKEPTTSVGFRGIGKFSGSAVAKKIIVTSSRKGSKIQTRVVIDAEAMFAHLRRERNPALDVLLEQHSAIETSNDEAMAKHYTFVELHGILPDSEALFDPDVLIDYLSLNVPVPYDNACPYSSKILRKVQTNVPDFFQSELTVNGSRVLKRFPARIVSPEFIPIYQTDEIGSPLMAFCWYCRHEEKGQLPEKALRGLTYRIKNFAIGDQMRPREDLWTTTPFLSYYFFGEIHLCNHQLLPTSDRSNLEDNATRQEMIRRCRQIPQRLNPEAQAESEDRKFAETLQSTEGLVQRVQQEKDQGILNAVERSNVEFQLKQAIQDVSKRARRMGKKKKSKKEQAFLKKAETTVTAARKLLTQLGSDDSQLFDVTKATAMGEDGKQVFAIVAEVLEAECGANPGLYQRIIRKISAKIREAFS